MIVLLIVAYCAAQFATRINSAGSFYVWVTRALGPGAGSAAGWGLILGYVFTGIACVIGFEIYGNNFLSGFGLSSPTNHVVKAILYIVGGVVPALMAVSDIKFSQRLAFILESIRDDRLVLGLAGDGRGESGVMEHQAGEARWAKRISEAASSSAWCWPSSPSSDSVGGRFRPGGEEPGPLGAPGDHLELRHHRGVLPDRGLHAGLRVRLYVRQCDRAAAAGPPGSAWAGSVTSSRSASPARCSPARWPA